MLGAYLALTILPGLGLLGLQAFPPLPPTFPFVFRACPSRWRDLSASGPLFPRAIALFIDLPN